MELQNGSLETVHTLSCMYDFDAGAEAADCRLDGQPISYGEYDAYCAEWMTERILFLDFGEAETLQQILRETEQARQTLGLLQ